MPADPALLAMADELALSTVMVLVTVAIHGFGLTALAKLLRVEAFEENIRHVPALSFRSLVFTQMLVLALFALHGIEIWLYGFVYVWIGAIGDLSTAVYFSTISYAAIGYTDMHIAPEWRLVGAIEGINGLLLLGWSTAFFVAVVIRPGRR
jgi:hypothetical protein